MAVCVLLAGQEFTSIKIIFEVYEFALAYFCHNKNGKKLAGHHEAPPFKYGGQVSAYHVRSIERFRLGLLEEKKRTLRKFFVC